MTLLPPCPPALQRRLEAALPLGARAVFAAVLLQYYWASALTKLGDGPLGWLRPSSGAYAQIFPMGFEAAGYDVDRLTVFHWAVALAATWGEVLLPLAIVLGLFTRLAALGMIAFVVVQSLTDLIGHGALSDPRTLGAWFDRAPDGVILDQRLLWVFVLSVLVVRGGGALSLDRLIARRLRNAPALRPDGPRPAP